MTPIPVTEKILQFGENRRLLGILSLPTQLDRSRPAVLIPNTGLDHRCGPNRLHVLLARDLARQGYACLRLDLGGLGDSDAAPGARADSAADLKLAMDELQAQGIATHFVAFGLCSGAHDAHQTARVDTRLLGLVLIDGYAYPTLKFHCHYWLQRLSQKQRLRNWLVKRLRRLGGETSLLAQPAPDGIGIYAQPTLEQVRADFADFTARKIPLLFLYTGQVQNEYNYAGQLYDMFPVLRGAPGVELHYLVHADHTFTRRQTRAEVFGLLKRWLAAHFPAGAQASSASR
jgi:pimeloyl-ACP methyl ester carboxylesterase